MCPLPRLPSVPLLLPAGEALSGAPFLQSGVQRTGSQVLEVAGASELAQPYRLLVCRVKMSCRAGAKRVEAKGVFVGAEVVRGPHWRFGDQDGTTRIFIPCSIDL